MPEIDASGPLDTWKYEDRDVKRQKQQQQLQGLQQQIAPLVQSGDWAAAQEAVANFKSQVTQKPTPQASQVGIAVKDKWENGGGNYNLNFKTTLPQTATIGPIDASGDAQLSNVNLRAKEGQIAQYDNAGKFQGFGPAPTSSGSWLDDVANGVKNVASTVGHALTHPIQSPEDMAPDFLSSLGGRAAIRSGAAAVGAPVPALKGAVGNVLDVAASPANLLGVGEAAGAANGWKAAVEAGVRQFGRNEGAGLTGLGASAATQKGVTAAANSNVPVLRDVAGNPIVRVGAPLVAGLGGGALAYEHPGLISSIPETVGNAAAKAGIVPEGGIPGAAAIKGPSLDEAGGVEAPPRSDVPAAGAPPPQTGSGAPGTPDGPTYTTVDSAGRPREVPELGQTGAEQAVAREQTIDRAPGQMVTSLPAFAQNVLGAFNPSLTLDRPVLLAYRARQAVKATLGTQFKAALQPKLAEVLSALTADPPEYIGPKAGEQYTTSDMFGKTVTRTASDAQANLIGTFKDIADRPQMYRMSPQVRAALDDYDQAQWDNVSAVARGQYGVDVTPYTADGTQGYVHTPTVQSKDVDQAVDSYAQARAGVSAGTKERVYQSAWDRVGAHADFQPETDASRLTDIHNQAMAQNAANTTLRLGSGGKTLVEVMEEEHPGLRDQKIAAQTRLASLKSHLTTLENAAGDRAVDARKLATAQANVEKRMEPLQTQIDALGDDYGPELSYLSGQVRELRQQAAQIGVKLAQTPADRENFKAQTLTAQAVNKAQNEVTALVKAYKNAGIDSSRWKFDPVTSRYYTPDAAKTMKQLTDALGPKARALNNAVQEYRGVTFTGDASPFTIQGALGLFASPLSAGRAVKWAIGENPAAALDRIAQQEPEDVAAYTAATRRPFGSPGLEFEQYRGLGRLPIGGGKRFGDVENGMFAVVQRMQYEMWKSDRDLLLKNNPDMDPDVAAHDAASVLSKVIPNLDPAERGLSPTRALIERTALTSTSFATSPALLMADATKALVKLGTGQQLAGRERLSLQRAFTMAASLATVSAASAALSAKSRNMSVADAIKESLDPSSSMFLSLQLGDGRKVGLGGPFRSFVKALVPQSYNGDNWIPLAGFYDYAKGKVAPPVHAAMDVFQNRDFYGKQIYDGSPLHKTIQGLTYLATQGFLPFAGQQAAQQVRQGQTSPSELAQGIGGQFLGVNYSPPSSTEQLNQIARSRGYDSYYDAPLSVQKSIQQGNPTLWQQKIAAGSAASQQYQDVKTQLAAGAQTRNAALLSGDITIQQWQDANTADGNKINQAAADAFGPQGDSSGGDPKLAPFYAEIEAETKNGVGPDWNAVYAWVAQQPQATQDYINANTGLSQTPLQKLRGNLLDQYYSIPKYSGLSAAVGDKIDQAVSQAQAIAGSTSNQSWLIRALGSPDMSETDPAILQMAKRSILGLLKPNTYRTQWVKQHPEFAIATTFGTSRPLTSKEIAAVQSALAKQK